MKINWDDKREEIEHLIKNGTSYVKIGKIYNISGNGIKKVAKRLNIDLPVRRSINENEHFNKGFSLKEKYEYNECPICGEQKYYTSKVCSKCRKKYRQNSIKTKTLGYFIDGKNYLSTKCNDIRRDARKVLEHSNREKVCEYCHNHEYDKILEVHHIKGILEFDKTTTIEEINSETNLVWLCPNHHKMLDLGLIKL